MLRNHVTAVLSTLIFGLAACGGGDPIPENPDNIVVFDLGGDVRNDVVGDTPDTGRPDDVVSDQVQTDVVSGDNVVPDSVVIDTVVTDTVATDSVFTDNPVTDTVVNDTNGTDTNGTDTNVTDTNGTDTAELGCSGACDPLIQSTRCLVDGTTICVCAQDTSTWTPYVCADACAANNMVGDQCVPTADGDTCNCTNDCNNVTLVAGQCDSTKYTECTCGTPDPCKWLVDGYCDSACVTLFPADHFTDTADCACSGTCDPAQFQGYCTLDAGACICSDTNQAVQNCATFCADMGGTGGVCDPQQGSCVCESFSCADPAKVQNQCTEGVYTPCTCAVADVCGWMTDAYCDSPGCNQAFPNQTNFDDTASAACQ